jgi:uncharacterized surface protein with fasciclin (FAS1) repeats
MKKSMIAIATATTLTFAGAASAECAMQKSDGHAGKTHYAMLTGTEGAFIKTGGYGKNDAKKAASQPDIVDTAVSAGSFNTLVKAVQAAGLVDTLKGDGPFTVFAPTDEAFAKLPAGTVESLLADQEKLAAVLKYHVVPGKLDAAAVTSKTELQTAEGSALPVGDIKIATTDIMTSNGIIHVIDQVLIPAS